MDYDFTTPWVGVNRSNVVAFRTPSTFSPANATLDEFSTYLGRRTSGNRLSLLTDDDNYFKIRAEVEVGATAALLASFVFVDERPPRPVRGYKARVIAGSSLNCDFSVLARRNTDNQFQVVHGPITLSNESDFTVDLRDQDIDKFLRPYRSSDETRLRGRKLELMYICKSPEQQEFDLSFDLLSVSFEMGD